MKLSAAAIVAGCGVAALAVLPLAMPPYYVGLMIPFYGYAIALLGFNLLFGYTGLLSFGHAMFLGVGAYGAAILSSVLGVKSFELVLLTVMLASCAIAADARMTATSTSSNDFIPRPVITAAP